MRDFLFSLRTRALLLVGLAFAVFVGAMGFQATAERQVRLEFARDHLQNTAKLIAAQQNRIIEYAQQFLESLIRAQNGRHAIVSQDCQRTLAQRLQEEPRIANIFVALPDGSVVCSATPTARPITIADRPYFQQALASPAVVIGEAVDSPTTGKRSLPFFKAVRDSSGRTLGVYAVSLDLSGLAREVANAKYPKGARIGLVDAKGQVLARHPDAEGWVGKDVSDTSFFKTVAAHGGDGTFEEVGFDGVPRVYGLARFAETASGPISLWLGFEKKTVTADVERHFAWTVLAVAGLLLVTFAAMWAAGELLFLRPISALSAAAHRMGQGDLSARTRVEHAHDELGRLAQSFDEMASSLEARDQHIVLANRAVNVLSAWNRALLATRDETSLIGYMCRAIVETGGYRCAWVGFARSDENKTVEPVAWWGMDPQFVAGLGITWADSPCGRGPTGTAIRHGTAVVVNDHMTNPDTAPWHELALRYKYNAVMSLPLKVNDAVIGALTIHAAESESFGEQEAVILTEVAATLSSGIAAVRSSAARTRLYVSLQSSEERFRAAADASPDALFVFKCVRDNAGNIVDLEIIEMNARAAQQLGMARDDIIGKTYLGLLPFFKTASSFDKYAQVATTGTRFEDEFPYDVPQKGKRWFRQQVVPVGDGIAISLRDITTWKNAGDKIREGEERLRLALAAAHMGTWSMSMNGDMHSVSEELGPIFGLSRGAGPRNTAALMEAVHPDDREALAKGIKRDRNTALGSHLEFRVLWPDGTIHWVEAHNNVICDEAGKPVRGVGVLEDITQRKLDVVALQRANRALKTLLAANEALVHATSESELLHKACRVIVDRGGYQMAWVGQPRDDKEKTIVTMAQAGAEDWDLAAVAHTWADNEQGQRPIARALRSGKAEIARDVRNDAAFAAVKELVARPGYASNLALPLLDGKRLIGAMSMFASEADAFDDAEVLLLQELADDLAYGITTLRTRAERDRIAHAVEYHEAILRKSLEDSIQAIAATVEMRDPYTSGHQKRVAELAMALAREMGLSEERIHGLHLAGVIHDLGKISVPAEILSKPGKLTPIEFMLIQGHAQAGYEILKDIDFPWPIATIVWQHHERVDGSGYPQGLKGGSILLESRITAVADIVEAMASHRPYRPALGIGVALQEIERGRGIQYDVAVADACLKLFREGRYTLVS
jgi:PAS domain S-box-containing protein/putative nucleotidyltransferase with HDIG domain